MSSTICTHFSQNAWKKDLCSNCFKSKGEHNKQIKSGVYHAKYSNATAGRSVNNTCNGLVNKRESISTKSDYANRNKTPVKSIIKETKRSNSSYNSKCTTPKVSFPKTLTQVIGYGGEWSDSDDDFEFMNSSPDKDDKVLITDDEDSLELQRITRANTDFNMNNGNLLASSDEQKSQQSFSTLKLGAPQVDKEGKKKTLQINVTPFGANLSANYNNYKLEINDTEKCFSILESPTKRSETAASHEINSTTCAGNTNSTRPSAANLSSHLDGKASPPIKRAMEKSLLDEISETLEKNQSKASSAEKATPSEAEAVGIPYNISTTKASANRKIKFEITSLTETLESKPLAEIKKPIIRNTPISKDQMKPKVNICHKTCDTDSVSSDTENSQSAYYDIVEPQTDYANLPDGKYARNIEKKMTTNDEEKPVNPVYKTSQYITDRFLTSRTLEASYNLQEGNFVVDQIKSDGIFVKKSNSDDAADSTGSSFDGSSDEETSYNMMRSESDSGICVSLNSDCKMKHITHAKHSTSKSFSINSKNSDYEDIQVKELILPIKEEDIAEKSRELHGEPDGSADPDGNLEAQKCHTLPSLPKTPPPSKLAVDARPSFLHGKPLPLAHNKKPDLPAKPSSTINTAPMKTFINKLNLESTEVNQKENDTTQPLNKGNVYENADNFNLKKTLAPSHALDAKSIKSSPSKQQNTCDPNKMKQPELPVLSAANAEDPEKLPSASVNSKTETSTYKFGNDPCIGANTIGKLLGKQMQQEKEKNERSLINPKFRTLNTFTTQRRNMLKNLQLPNSNPTSLVKQMRSSKPIVRDSKTLSLSEQCLNEASGTAGASSASTTNISAIDNDKKCTSTLKAKAKFSIKKFLRMGSMTKNIDTLGKSKESIYSEICTGEDNNVIGKSRLVIIHPIDMNPMAVEVVKDITKTKETVTAQTMTVLTSITPAPPLRSSDLQKTHEFNKPARPPPPKSTELHRNHNCTTTSINTSMAATSALTSTSTNSATHKVGEFDDINPDSIKTKADNVYANLGEIRSSIAPRKPERTASMREREAQIDLAHKPHLKDIRRNDSADSDSLSCLSGDAVLTSHVNLLKTTKCSQDQQVNPITAIASGTTTFQPQPSEAKAKNSLNKLELQNFANECNSNTLKNSVRKITHTIDNYLRDKRDYEQLYECVKVFPSCSIDQRAIPSRPNNLYSDVMSVASCSRSEYALCSRGYGLNNKTDNMPRLASTSYCCSENSDFDAYSPYSFYSSDAFGDGSNDINDSMWSIPAVGKNSTKTTNRLRMRKGRSVVHKTIEDNYSAVVAANHEALAQVLEQLQQTSVKSPALRTLSNAINLRYEDFTILDGIQAFVVGGKAFHAALWNSIPVTLALSADCNQLTGVNGDLNQMSGGVSNALNPVTEFCDVVPSYNLPLIPTTEISLLQATISVLPRLQMDTLQSIGGILKGKSEVLDKSNSSLRGSIPNLNSIKDINKTTSLRNGVSVQNLSNLNENLDENCVKSNEVVISTTNSTNTIPAFNDIITKEVAFIMLQLINGMKNLQVKAVEEMPINLSNVVLIKEVDNKDAQARLCVLQGTNNNEHEVMGTLCKCAYNALTEMLPVTKITPILAGILQQERSESLSKSKSVLEFILWGPSDVTLTGSTKEREQALQRWLDLERATVLHGLVQTRIELTIYDECHLMFLVRSTARIMNDAAKLISSYQDEFCKKLKA